MLCRERTFAEERAAILAAVRAKNPHRTSTRLVIVRPRHPLLPKWIVGAYPTLKTALAVADTERALYPPHWVDVTIEAAMLRHPLDGTPPVAGAPNVTKPPTVPSLAIPMPLEPVRAAA